MGGRPLSEVYNADTNLSNLFMDADRRNIPYSCKYEVIHDLWTLLQKMIS
jgi:hypothetical protein